MTLNNVDLVKELTSFEGRLWNYRFSEHAKLVQESLDIYKQIIVVKSIPIVQEVYTRLLVEFDMSLATLLKNCSTTTTTKGEDESGDLGSGVGMLDSVKNAETSFLFNLCVLAELGNASKSNLIIVKLHFPKQNKFKF